MPWSESELDLRCTHTPNRHVFNYIQLSFSLNAQHDGHGNNCPASDGYIMAPGTRVTESSYINKRLWEFSHCSLDYFDAFIAKLNM